MTVEDGYRGVKQSWGKYTANLGPGCHFYNCCYQQITPLSIRIVQVDVDTDTKTFDNVSVGVKTAVQYAVQPDKVQEAYFGLTDPKKQMAAYVDDVVRSELPTLTLDEAYEAKTVMADNITKVLAETMAPFGFQIIKVLITDLQPDARVLAAMNQINTQKRQRAAMQEKAEGDKILRVKAAEAEMEATHLSGKGVAKMRLAITNGFKESISDMQESCGLHPKDVVHMMLVTQYLDTLKEFSDAGRSSLVLPHGPEAISSIERQVSLGFDLIPNKTDMPKKAPSSPQKPSAPFDPRTSKDGTTFL